MGQKQPQSAHLHNYRISDALLLWSSDRIFSRSLHHPTHSNCCYMALSPCRWHWDLQGLCNLLQHWLMLSPLPPVGSHTQQEDSVLVGCGGHKMMRPQLPAIPAHISPANCGLPAQMGNRCDCTGVKHLLFVLMGYVHLASLTYEDASMFMSRSIESRLSYTHRQPVRPCPT